MRWSSIPIAERLEIFEARIARAEVEGLIYNVDFQDLKDQVNRMLEEAYDKLHRAQTYGPRWAPPILYRLSPYAHQVPNLRAAAVKDLKALEGRKDQLSEEEYHDFLQAIAEIVVFAETWTPLCERFSALKKITVKGRKPSEDADPSKQRDLANTGTCGICGKNVKRAQGGGLHAHGYTLNYGTRNGNCFGVGRPPVEVSDAVYGQFLESVLRPQLANTSERLRSLHKDEVDSFEHPNFQSFAFSVRSFKRAKERYPDVERGDARFGELRRRAVDEAEYEVAALERMIADFESRLQNWTPAPLPDQPRASSRD
jgi:hypothetical protein